LVSELKRELPELRMLFTRTVYDNVYQIIRNPAAYGKKLHSAVTSEVWFVIK
jgi:hypothetical protein